MRRRDVILAGLAAATVGGWRSADLLSRISAPYTGTVRTIGPGGAYASIAAAQTAAADGDRLLCLPGTPRESLSITKSVWLDLAGVQWDFTGVASTTLAGGGLGALDLNGTNILVTGGNIMGTGLDLTSGDLTSALRITAGSGNVTIYGGYFHGNQNGVGAGPIPVNITLIGTKLWGNGLTVNSGSLTHNCYIGEVTSLTLINVDSRAPVEAHAMKSRAAQLHAIGGFYQSDHGACFDIPEGGFFTLESLTMQKLLATADDEKFLNYASENTFQGFSNANTITNCRLDLQMAIPSTIHTLGGTITFVNPNTKTGLSPTAFGGGLVVNIP